MQPLLWTLQDVCLNGTSRFRLQSITTDIASGVTAVVGDSGAGKSSLLNVLVRFELPSRGKIVCHGVPDARQLPIYWLPPGDGLWSHLTLRQHLETVSPRGAEVSATIDRIISGLDLQGLVKSRPDELSQGERSRLAMARALASRARILVLDEPLVHISLARQTAYWDLVRDLCQEFEMSLVMATHDIDVIARESDRLLLLEQGRLAYSGPLASPHSPLASTAATVLLQKIVSCRQEHLKTRLPVKQNSSAG